jgi:RNA polymerase sigma-70 factor (ECF subfamily)
MAQDAALAEDLTQETFASAWRSIHQFEGRASFATWLHKIALNVYRKYRQRRRLPVASLDEERLADPADTESSLIEQLEAEELRQRAWRAVERLPETYRELIVLRYYQGLRYREVAELLGVPMGTVQFRLHTAMKKLQAELREEVGENDAHLAPDPAKS